jgi:hypothetical protein
MQTLPNGGIASVWLPEYGNSGIVGAQNGRAGVVHANAFVKCGRIPSFHGQFHQPQGIDTVARSTYKLSRLQHESKIEANFRRNTGKMLTVEAAAGTLHFSQTVPNSGDLLYNCGIRERRV